MGEVFLKRRQAFISEVINDFSGDVANLSLILQRHYPQFMDMQRLSFGGRIELHFGINPARTGRVNITKLAPILEDVHERLSGVVIENKRSGQGTDHCGVIGWLNPMPSEGVRYNTPRTSTSDGQFVAI